ncbi:MAG: hypothetical protein QOF46_1577 [Paraburkholderia sp.]|nr:hypothetical protein [Paraburkholderia sp.]
MTKRAPQPALTLRRAQRRRKNDGCVTNAECATTQIPDAPLPRLCEGPAYELAV